MDAGSIPAASTNIKATSESWWLFYWLRLQGENPQPGRRTWTCECRGSAGCARTTDAPKALVQLEA